MTRHLFTSESVSMGHPDKVADRIADAVLDHMLEHDPCARVACEILVTGTTVVVAGEIRSGHAIGPHLEGIVRSTIADIGYDAGTGFDLDGAEVLDRLQVQSGDIALGVDTGGAGDQGMMFGHAARQTEALMPLPIMLAHGLVARQAEVRVSGEFEGLRPDAKSQVTVEYEGREPVGVRSVLLSTQHDESWHSEDDEFKARVTEQIVRPVLGARWWRDGMEVLVNPTGRFVTGGPEGDTGVTGRKIIVDTYGGWGRHGGGAFSGKDPTKVDRSASYMARHVAKNAVAAGLADEIEVRLSYAIGRADPTAVSFDTFGTARADDADIEAYVRGYPLTPNGIIEYLGLRRPIYVPTSYHGHFGREPGADGTFSWERIGPPPG
ncbi:MAG: methionine adenosyltransferase [Actinobacteria bacterium]|nr:methionine adenosyltransferase [Actinomycetota bacterium]